jgi:hypothetical protein
LPGVVVLPLIASVIFFVRRRRLTGTCLLALTMLTVFVVLIVAGHEVLRNDWFAPVVEW